MFMPGLFPRWADDVRRLIDLKTKTIWLLFSADLSYFLFDVFSLYVINEKYGVGAVQALCNDSLCTILRA